jgi:hypothetical protein
MGGAGGAPCHGEAGEEAAGPEAAEPGWSKLRSRGAWIEAAGVEIPRDNRDDPDAGWLLRPKGEDVGSGEGSAGSRAGVASFDPALGDGRAWPLGTALDRSSRFV